MKTAPLSWRFRGKEVATSRSFWIIVVMLILITLLHYLTPQLRSLWPPMGAFLSRHAVERIVFLLPVTSAAFAFGQAGGLITLALSVLIMLPRIVLLSPYPWDAAMETVSVAVVGYLVIWMIATLERERMLRQKVVARLRAIHAVAEIVTRSLDLDHVLKGALEKVLEVMGLEAGLIFLLEEQAQTLVLAAHRGISEESAARSGRLALGEGPCGRVAESGEPMIVRDAAGDPWLIGEGQPGKELWTQIIVPLRSKGAVQGVLAVATEDLPARLEEEIELVAAIGRQIGVAIENARLHQDVERQLRIEHRLNEVAKEITSELELDRILPKVIQIAEELIGTDGGVIALLDRERGVISYPYLHNLPQELAEVTVPAGGGLAGAVMAAGRPLIIQDYRSYPDAVASFVEAGVTSVLAVPIISSGQFFGALGLVSLDEMKKFSERDVAILSGMGRQAGIAIENARLYETMRFYVRQITRAQEDERRRIARELHDDTAQMLVAISRRLDVLTSPSEPLPEPARRRLGQLRELVAEALQGVRRFSRDLRPAVLDDLGLLPAIEGLANELEAAGIETVLQVSGPRQRLHSEVELVLFRIIQEALRNVHRHAHASRVVLGVVFSESRVKITVEDNGQGFELPGNTVDLVARGKLGLTGMYERAQLIDGVLTLQSELGKGTVMTVDVPVR